MQLKTFFIHTYGCSMNYADTERLVTILHSMWLEEVSKDSEADVIIFNTCSIKQKAEDKVFWTFKKLKNKKLGITGCMVKESWIRWESKDPIFKKTKLVDFVFRTLDMPKLPEIIAWIWVQMKEDKDEFFSISQTSLDNFRAIVPIQIWCDNYCSYCVVPYSRWREWSRSMEDILKEIKWLANKWIKEINLVGQNVNSYGKGMPNIKRKWDEENSKWFDWTEKTPFSLLLEEICMIDWIERLRFQSSNPHDMTSDIIEVICKENKIMPQVHLALQSWNNEVLKRMRRRHTLEDFVSIVRELRNWKPNISITTDIIVWFCGETESEFEDTMKAIQEIKFDMIYLSQYSERSNTYAQKHLKDDVAKDVKLQRWHKINNLLKDNVASRLWAKIGEIEEVMIEKEDIWKTPNWFVCKVIWGNYKPGDLVKTLIKGKSDWSIYWEAM